MSSTISSFEALPLPEALSRDLLAGRAAAASLGSRLHSSAEILRVLEETMDPQLAGIWRIKLKLAGAKRTHFSGIAFAELIDELIAELPRPALV